MIFLQFSFYRKYDISLNCRKSKKYGIHAEGFYENIVFHAVEGDINFWQILIEHNFKQTKKPRFNGGFSGH